jgi:hypothetical protein
MALPLLPDDYKNLCGKSPEFNHSEMDFNIEEFKDRLYDDVKLAIKEFGKSKIENANGKRIFDYVFDILTGDEEMPNINVDVEKTIDGIAKSAKEAVNVAIRNKLC